MRRNAPASQHTLECPLATRSPSLLCAHLYVVNAPLCLDSPMHPVLCGAGHIRRRRRDATVYLGQAFAATQHHGTPTYHPSSRHVYLTHHTLPCYAYLCAHHHSACTIPYHAYLRAPNITTRMSSVLHLPVRTHHHSACTILYHAYLCAPIIPSRVHTLPCLPVCTQHYGTCRQNCLNA